MRQYEKELASGKIGKNPIEEILENQQVPRMIQELENSQDSSENKNQYISLLQEELEKIKNLQQNKQNNIAENENNTTDLYSNQDLDVLFRNKKNRGLNQKEKIIDPKNLKLQNSSTVELNEDEMTNRIGDQVRKRSQSENELREKEFYSLFDKTKLNKNKKKSNNETPLSTMEKEFLANEPMDVTKIRNLRKIKNLTNREYNEHNEYNSSMETTNNDVEVVDSIPEMNIIDKRLRNADDEETFKDLIKSDMRPWEKSLEKKEAVLHDAKKLSKITTINNISLKNQRNEIFKRRALVLAKLWQMPAPETKHWYYKLKREEKEIIKVVNMRKKLEQRRKLKQLKKQWTIDNKEILDLNYADFLNKDNSQADKKEMSENIKIPKHFNNINEFLFFGEDHEFMRHYKRTCRNIEHVLNEFFRKNKQSIMTGIGRNVDISITEVKMNKACTVIYAWWDLPYVTGEIMKTKNEENEAIFKSVEFKINQASPYIVSHITRKIGLKYAPDIKFVRDCFDEEVNSFDDYLQDIKNDKNKLQQANMKDVHGDNFMKIIATNQFQKEIREQIEQVKYESTKTFLKNFFLDEKINMVNKFMALKINHPDEFHKILEEVKKTIDLSKYGNLFEEKNGKDETNLNREEKRAQVRRHKVLKKMHLREEDLKSDTHIDYTNSLYNFVHNYERKIPGQFALGSSFKEMTKKSEKSQFLTEEAEKSYRNQIKKAVRESDEIGKHKKTKKEKTSEFWKNLERGVI